MIASLLTQTRVPTSSLAVASHADLLKPELVCDGSANLAIAPELIKGNQLNLRHRDSFRAETSSESLSVPDQSRSSSRLFDLRTNDSREKGFGHNFNRVRVHQLAPTAESARLVRQPHYIANQYTDGRGVVANGKGDVMLVSDLRWPSAEARVEDKRPGRSDDPVHESMLDTFRRQQGQPPGGVDEAGNQIGPTDAEIKYRPQPIAVLNGPFHAPIDDPTEVGMEIQITVQSSSSDNADMAQVQDSEKVSMSFDHTGSLISSAPIPSSQSGFMSAVNIPNDRHAMPRGMTTNIADNLGGSGSFSKHQLDVYTDARRGVVSPIVIPNSGYLIKRTITTGPGTQIKLRVDKSPAACTVDGFTTTAGPSPAQHDEVMVRP